MTVRYPRCPNCGKAFDVVGAFRPKGDGTDVIGYTHHDPDRACPDVWAVAQDDPDATLVRLGTIHEYGDDVVPFLRQTHYQADIDLRPEGRFARIGFSVLQWFRRRRRRFG
jgi:hypothetical protein